MDAPKPSSLRFSIAIPTYQGACDLPQAMDSVLSQPGSDYELIIVDDGSSDPTEEIVAGYRADHGEKVRYSWQEHRGPGAARNRAVTLATGDYLIFLDVDDRLLPRALETFRQVLMETPEPLDCAFGGYQVRYPHGGRRDHRPAPLSPEPRRNFVRFLRKEGRWRLHGSAVVHRRVFDRLAYPTGIANNEDVVLLAQILALYRCRTFPQAVAAIHRGRGTLRYSLHRSALEATEALFDPEVLPLECLALRSEFLSSRYLSLFRRYYRAGEFYQARASYAQALRVFPRHLLKVGYLGKYLHSLFKG